MSWCSSRFFLSQKRAGPRTMANLDCKTPNALSMSFRAASCTLANSHCFLVLGSLMLLTNDDSEECNDARRSILASSSGSRLRAPSWQVPSLMSASERSQASSQHPSHPNQTKPRAKTSRTGSIPSKFTNMHCCVNQLCTPLGTSTSTSTHRLLM